MGDARRTASVPTPIPAGQPFAWLLLLHQLPSEPTSLRVRVWRRLQQLGAVPIKNSAHALPDSPDAREDFEWLRTEITSAGGQATLFVAATLDAWAHDALVDEFRRSREIEYAVLAREAERLSQRTSPTAREPTRRAAAATIRKLRRRLAAVERVDFFGSAGRDRVIATLGDLERRLQGRKDPGASADAPREQYRKRLWVTRPRPGVDRMASAWLIRRFIDPEARFAFVADAAAAPDDAVPFDMFGVEFTHHGERCTFEVLCGRFTLQEPALARVAAIVHDLDLKDARFKPDEAPAIGSLIDGLQLAQTDDQLLLSSGMSMFEALYLKFTQQEQPGGPRPVARRGPQSAGSTRKRSRS